MTPIQPQNNDEKLFRLKHYDIIITPKEDRKLAIKALDLELRIEFSENQLVLEQIGTSTLITALQGKRKQVTVEPHYKKQGDFEILQLHVKVESLFLKSIDEIIYIKKVRTISQAEFLSKKINNLSKNVKTLKIDNEKTKGFNYFNIDQGQKYFHDATYEPLISLRLPKGKYLLTFSFLAKATNTWLYVYLNQGQTIMTNSGFYVPTGTNFIPYTIRKVYTVNEDYKEVSFTTNGANSYPAYLKNRIVTAQPLKQ